MATPAKNREQATAEDVGNMPPDSHKQWRALLKKQKRKRKRQALAKTLAEQEGCVNEAAIQAGYPGEDRLDGETQLEEQAERERKELHQLWLEREQAAQREWQAKKEAAQLERERREEEEERIRKEWEELQQKERAEEKKKQEQVAEKTAKQEQLLKEATKGQKAEGPWHNPLAPSGPYQERDIPDCPFYMKTGACRFGDRCSRYHPKPDSSCTLLFPGMYSHFVLEQGLDEEFDNDLYTFEKQTHILPINTICINYKALCIVKNMSQTDALVIWRAYHDLGPGMSRKYVTLYLDISLEYEDRETRQHFREFYDDALPEFQSVGHVVQFKVSCNHEPHLRGNVYVQYQREEDAQGAFQKFNGRFYAGRLLNCEFTVVTNWKHAICGLFHRKKCPKGKTCNFLHVFRNPGNDFWEADRMTVQNIGQHEHDDRRFRERARSGSHRRERERSDRRTREGQTYSSRSYYYSRNHKSHSISYSRSRSRSPERSYHSVKYHHYRSQSPLAVRRKYSTSRSRSRSRSPKYSQKRRKRSKSPHCRRKNSRSFSRSPHDSYNRYSRSKSRSVSPTHYHRRPSGSKFKSKSPSRGNHVRSRSKSNSPRSQWRSRMSRSRSKSPQTRHASRSLSPSLSLNVVDNLCTQDSTQSATTKTSYESCKASHKSPNGNSLSSSESEAPCKVKKKKKRKKNKK